MFVNESDPYMAPATAVGKITHLEDGVEALLVRLVTHVKVEVVLDIEDGLVRGEERGGVNLMIQSTTRIGQGDVIVNRFE